MPDDLAAAVAAGFAALEEGPPLNAPPRLMPREAEKLPRSGWREASPEEVEAWRAALLEAAAEEESRGNVLFAERLRHRAASGPG